MDDLPDVGLAGDDAFTVEADHTTHVFGTQTDPPGRPAATDAAPNESVRVLGTPQLLARVEFASRETLRGQLPTGTGVVGEAATVRHSAPVAVGTRVSVHTELVAVDGVTLSFEATIRADADAVVGTAAVDLRVVDRDRFRAAVDDRADAG